MADFSRRDILRGALKATAGAAGGVVAADLALLAVPRALARVAREEAKSDTQNKKESPDFNLDPFVKSYIDKVRNKEAVIKQGTDPRVWKAVQQILNKVEPGPAIAVTGKYDESTYLKLTDFQRGNGLQDDGEIGHRTMAKFDQRLAEKELDPKGTRNKHDPFVLSYFAKVRNREAKITQGTDPRVWKETQHILNLIAPGPKIAVTGKYEDTTYLKLTDFQRANKLKPDGEIGHRTMAKFDQHRIRLGDMPEPQEKQQKGQSYPREIVLEVQDRLRKHIFPDIGYDGFFGKQTSYWLALFQLQQGLSPTGEIDMNTRIRLQMPLQPKPLDYQKLPRTTLKGHLAGTPLYFTARQIGRYYLDERTTKAFLKMVDAALRDGVHLDVSSAFRSYEEQSILYKKFKADQARSKKLKKPRREPNANPPKYSRHEFGGAVDIKRGVNKSSQNWLKKNAAIFGFEAPYSNEPWHYQLKKQK